MIVTRIKGGLGNQLFAYAAARRCAIANNDTLLLDSISGFSRDHKFNRNFQLSYFEIDCDFVQHNSFLGFIYLLQRKLLRVSNKWRPFSKRNYIEQEFADFDERLLSVKTSKNKKITLDGLWQSELYFSDIEDTIRRDLQFRIKLNDTLCSTIDNVCRTESVAIHIRMFGAPGDAKNVSPEYYRKAIEEMQLTIANPVFYLFSDDVGSAENLLRTLNVDFVNISAKNYHEVNDVAELLIMSKCDHHIIANSTFSWWGAWLAKHNNQEVIYPLPSPDSNWCWNYEGQMPKSWKPIGNLG